jgi:hypothetical protein
MRNETHSVLFSNLKLYLLVGHVHSVSQHVNTALKNSLDEKVVKNNI